MSDYPELQRVTTEYVATQDRIRLSGAVIDGQTVVLWMTQRLFNRLIPPMTKWLEENGGGAAAAHAASPSEKEMLQEFAQQSAQAALTPQPRVKADEPSDAWLVDTLGVTTAPRGVIIAFKAADGRAVTLTLAAEPLRQWLGVVRLMYGKGEWTMAVWPAWMDETRQPSAKPDTVPLH